MVLRGQPMPTSFPGTSINRGKYGRRGGGRCFPRLSTMPLLRVPFGDSRPVLASTQLYWLQVMARARPGFSDEQARASLDVALGAAVRAPTTTNKGDNLPHIRVEDGSKGLNEVAPQYGKPLYVLLVMVGAVLLMACA